jgi:hypothetical protein
MRAATVSAAVKDSAIPATGSSNATIRKKPAIACGRRLLRTRSAASSSYRAWATLDGKLLTGFSHGAAGIAYALLRLYAASGEEDFREAAREAIAYEDSVFVPEAGNWPDLRQEEPSCMTSWCHGAPGIGLARLGGLAALATDQIQQDIAVAMRTTQQFGLRGVESLCCGALGRSDVLLSADVRLSRGFAVDGIVLSNATRYLRGRLTAPPGTPYAPDDATRAFILAVLGSAGYPDAGEAAVLYGPHHERVQRRPMPAAPRSSHLPA